MNLEISLSDLDLNEFKQLARAVGGCDGAPGGHSQPTIFGDARRAMLHTDRPLIGNSTQHQLTDGIYRVAAGSAGAVGRIVVTSEGEMRTERFILADEGQRDAFVYGGWTALHLDPSTLPTDQQVGSDGDDKAGLLARDAYLAAITTPAWIGKLVYAYQAPPTPGEIAQLASTPSSWKTRTFKVMREGQDRGRLFREIHVMVTGQVVVDEYWLLHHQYDPPAINKTLVVELIPGGYTDLRTFLAEQTANVDHKIYVQGTIHFDPV